MAFETTVTIAGDNQTYVFNPKMRKYALTDLGFVTNNAGTYVMERALQPMKGLQASIKLKVMVDKNLTGIKIKTLNPAGTDRVDIFKISDNEEMVELYHYYLNELVAREVMTIAD
ncbi:cysteine desulfurase [Weissella tructae]|jgi:hypothetical protein|uniref:Cysteine desulfurase n=2 Tax=Weissella TaxID=46255 RepID=A0A075TYA3_9LACO|nr:MULTISPECIES: hypothetical protein [Weissella]AIG65205.1 hypothetical protein WS08_0266 [Weissella tructae]AIM62518.1 hypothetical protein WS74_0266 [Weissella ceti]ELA07605.1 hypothetical protein WCNC_01340 [Weissella ceti NC36]QVV91586.1 cysteine desulfurase [Weissella tructae]